MTSSTPATEHPSEKREHDVATGASQEARPSSPEVPALEVTAPEVTVPRIEPVVASSDAAIVRVEPAFDAPRAPLPPVAPPAPTMIPAAPIPTPSVSGEPATEPPVEPVRAPRPVSIAADEPTLMVSPTRVAPAAAQVAPNVVAPVVVAPAVQAAAPSVAPPSPPRMPPPLPPEAIPQPRLEAPRRPMLAPEQHPMPSTITPTEPVRKRSNFRSKAARSSVVVVFDGMMSLAAVVAVVLFVGAFAYRQEFELPGPLTQAKTVVIPPKKTREEIGDILEKSGVVSSGTVFQYGTVLAQISDLKAGEYEFHPQQSMRDVAEQIHENKVVQHKITFPEGWTSEQIVQRLLDYPILTGKIVAIPEEGSLLPDTYTYPMGESRQQMLDRMHKAQERRLTEIWAHRNAEMLRQLKVPKDLVILASIVEKETSKADERPRVAAVFVNRLNRNMRLETDPTILYGLYGGKAWTEPRTISKSDLIAPNPYNTYKINGLPPGPIANPGRAALEAAANPAQTNDLFFVADGTGGHTFAETIEEHNRNVAKWREIERQRHAADPNASPIGAGTGVLVTQPGTSNATTPAANARTPANQRNQPATQQRQQRPRVTVPADPGGQDTN